MSTDVILKWKRVGSLSAAWEWARTFYALYHRETGRMLYIGKADCQSLHKRMACRSKETLWEFLSDELGLSWRDVGMVAAEVYTESRWTSQLQADVESLLIKRLQPNGNIQSRTQRIERPGLQVFCIGSWPHKRIWFRDVA